MALDWHYHRNGCNTCARAQDYLTRKKVSAASVVDARKNRISPDEAVQMARKFDEIYASKGTKVVHVDMRKEKVDDDQLKALIVGPSGNLRAPTLHVGKTLLVGFDEASYDKVLK
ncbi:MAG TPA: ArsC family (seleno)protein [Drouetiella sp.]